MSPAHVLEPTYEAIKRRLMTAHWEMGTRLEAMKLADDLGVSITPVRDSLNRLFGEHLVDFIHGEGFRVPVMNESEIRDLLALNHILLMAATQSDGRQSEAQLQSGMSIGEYTAHLFLNLSGRTGNSILIGCVASINDRLHVARNVEAEILPDIEDEFSELTNACKSGETARAMLKGLLPRYLERRVEKSAEYIRILTGK